MRWCLTLNLQMKKTLMVGEINFFMTIFNATGKTTQCNKSANRLVRAASYIFYRDIQ